MGVPALLAAGLPELKLGPSPPPSAATTAPNPSVWSPENLFSGVTPDMLEDVMKCCADFSGLLEDPDVVQAQAESPLGFPHRGGL